MSCTDECATDKTEAREFAYFSGLSAGAKAERKRILNLIKSYWCGEPECTNHIPDWETFIMEIAGESE